MHTAAPSFPRPRGRIVSQTARDIACLILCGAAFLGILCVLFNIPWLVEFTRAIDQMALAGGR